MPDGEGEAVCIDWFGNGAHFLSENDQEVTVRVRVNEAAMRYWALQYVPHVRSKLWRKPPHGEQMVGLADRLRTLRQRGAIISLNARRIDRTGQTIVKRIIFIALASICAALGFIGVFVPVLPTTPFLLLSAFLFARSSPRMKALLESTRVYKGYVLPFKENGGITASQKARILIISFVVMGISAALVQRWFVWLILALVAAWLLYLMLVRIPTVGAAPKLCDEDVRD